MRLVLSFSPLHVDFVASLLVIFLVSVAFLGIAFLDFFCAHWLWLDRILGLIRVKFVPFLLEFCQVFRVEFADLNLLQMFEILSGYHLE